MDPQVDLFCARQLVTSLYVTPEQVQEAFEIQRAIRRDGGDAESLLDLLLAKGSIDREQAAEVAAAVESARSGGKFVELEASVDDGDDGDAGQSEATGAGATAGVPAGLAIPDVDLEARVGTGTTGVDFRGTHRSQGQPVMVHVLFPKFARDADARDAFIAEGESAAQVTHPAVLPLVDVGESGSRVYAVHAWPAGRSLAAVAADGPLAEDRVREIGRQVADALVAAGAADFEHGALRPDAIFIDTDHDDEVQVRFPVRPQDEAGAITPAEAIYAPPEYQSDAEPDPSADLYALGVCCMHALVGRPPLSLAEDDTVDTVLDRAATGLPRTNDLAPNVSSAMATLVDWLSAPSPDARPADATQASASFAMAAAGVEPIPDRPVRGAPVSRSASARRSVRPDAPPRRETRRTKRRAAGGTPRRPNSAPSPVRAAPRSRSEPATRSRPALERGPLAPSARGLSPAVIAGAAFGGLLLLIVIVAALFGGGESSPARRADDRRVAKQPSEGSRFKPITNHDPFDDDSGKPVKPTGPAPPDHAQQAKVQREKEAGDYLDKAKRKLVAGEFDAAFQMLEYLLRVYQDTDFVTERTSEIESLLEEAAEGLMTTPGALGPDSPAGPAPAGPFRAPPGTQPAPPSVYTVIDGAPGDWQVFLRNGALAQVAARTRGRGNDGHSGMAITNQAFADCSVQSRVILSGDRAEGGAALIFRYDQPSRRRYALVVLRGVISIVRVNGDRSTSLAAVSTTLDGEGEFQLAVVARGNEFEGYINGRLAVSATDDAIASGAIGFAKFGDSTAIFDDIQFQDRAVGAGGLGPAPGPGPAPDPVPGPRAAPSGSWTPVDGGAWSWRGDGVAEGKDEGLGSYGHCVWLDRSSGAGDGVVECEVKLEESDDGAFAGIALHSDGNQQALECYIYKTTAGAGWRIARFADGQWTKIDTGSFKTEIGAWTSLKTELTDGRLAFRIDGKKVFDETVPVPAGTHCGLVKYGKTHAQWRRITFPRK